jgi:hypothetical protein
MRRLSTVILLIACSFAVFQCSDDGAEYDRQKFLGEWEISEVIYDGVSQPDWTGATLTFTQMAIDSGGYSLPETPYDSIWTSTGHWIKLEETDIFYREDKVSVQYWIDVDERKMILDLYLPWTQQSTCADSVCLPIVTGHWVFELKK